MASKKNISKYPKFSVLMSVYEKEDPDNLDQALLSIENQTVVPNEIVLVEDGPVGRELNSIVEKHRQKFSNTFKTVKLTKNRGRGVASRTGLTIVSNNWVARADSDDISKRNRFELQLKAISQDPSIKMIGGQIQEFSDNMYNIVGKRSVPTNFETIKKYAKYRSPINNPSIMFQKETLIKIGGYPLLNVMEDYDLCIKFLAANFKVVNLPEILVNMRVDKNLYSRRGGLNYLLQYIKLKIRWRRLGIGDVQSVIVSCISMIVSSIIPTALRKVIYQRVLHRISN